MAIKAIENIPEAEPVLSQRDIIRSDIQEAVSKGISQFEFIDDRYKYDTLITNAREAIKMWFHREIYYPAYNKARERLKAKISEPFWGPSSYDYDKKVFFLSKRKLDDRVHVYCTLNLDIINNIEQVIYDDTLKEYTDNWPERIIGG